VRVQQREPAVIVDGVSKRFRVPQERVHTLKERALHPFRHIAFNTFDALKDVSFEVGEGEFFGIVGRNGSGKSTLLKMLAGIYGTDAGSIAVRGRMSTFIELGVGFNPDLAAFDNVVTNAVMLGLTPREAAARYDKVIGFAELEEFQDLKIKNYSSGMLVRLAFSVALEAEADILLIDEVLAVGDAAFQQKCFDEFNRLREENRTILFVTHDMGMVERFCHRAMLLEQGEMVTIGKPVEIARKYLEINFEQARREGGEHVIGSSPTGDGSADIEEVWIEDAQGERIDAAPHGDELRLCARIRFSVATENPVMAVVIVNEQGHNVTAASTLHALPDTGTFAAGDVASFRADFVNHLAPGRYDLSMVVSRQGTGFDVMHRLERAATIVVHHATATGGLVDFPFSFAVERSNVGEPA
jgi:ABC-type polysaccharide/polyol phosphate transport system ATPase subunit